MPYTLKPFVLPVVVHLAETHDATEEISIIYDEIVASNLRVDCRLIDHRQTAADPEPRGSNASDSNDDKSFFPLTKVHRGLPPLSFTGSLLTVFPLVSDIIKV